MKINQIQSQLAVNRQLIKICHEKVDISKTYRSFYSDDKQWSDYYHKSVIADNKRIAKLVALQKALKKDLARELSYERAARQLNLVKASCMANVGEVF